MHLYNYIVMPRISTRKRQYTRNLRDCPKPKCARMESMADTIVTNAIKIGLSVCADSPTPGDGNCFYHSVLQQLAPKLAHLPQNYLLRRLQLSLVLTYILHLNTVLGNHHTIRSPHHGMM